MPVKSTKLRIIGLLVINILVWSCYSMAFVQIKSGEVKMSALEDAMRENLKKQEIMLVLSKNLSDTTLERQKIVDLIIPKEGEVDFIKYMEDLVASNNLKSEIKSVKLEQVASSSLLENMVVSLDVIGSWSNVVAFETLLEKNPRFLSLDSFSLSKFDTYDAKNKPVSQWLGSFSFKVAKIKE